MTTIASATIAASERAASAVVVARTVEVISYDADQQTVRVREVVGADPIEIDGVPVRWPIDAHLIARHPEPERPRQLLRDDLVDRFADPRVMADRLEDACPGTVRRHDGTT